MTRLVPALVCAIAAALTAPAMAASHAGGAPMKANQPSPHASAPATHKKEKKEKNAKKGKKETAAHKEPTKVDDAKKNDAAKK